MHQIFSNFQEIFMQRRSYWAVGNQRDLDPLPKPPKISQQVFQDQKGTNVNFKMRR